MKALILSHTVLALQAKAVDMLEKIKVFAMYDSANETWDVMTFDKKCLFYGTVDGLETWLDEHSDAYEEVEL